MMSGVHTQIVGTPEPLSTAEWLWPDESHAQTMAHALAQQNGLAHAFIELKGNLGAGKTTWVRHLLQALGVHGRIKSPTYAVVEPHEAQHPLTGQSLAIWHFDFYRFNDPQEFEEAGFRDLFASKGLKLAEWPEKAKGMLPLPDLRLALTVNELQERLVRLEAWTAQGESILKGLRLAMTPLTSEPPSSHAHATP
jgi:tRNA threonylcarbamoyladenosine biosynthesis protein TsaE